MDLDDIQTIHYKNGYFRSIDGHWINESLINYIKVGLRDPGYYIIFCESRNNNFLLAEAFESKENAQEILDEFITRDF